MNKEQEKFWDIISHPHERSCYNCTHVNIETTYEFGGQTVICGHPDFAESDKENRNISIWYTCKHSITFQAYQTKDTNETTWWEWDEK